MNWFNAKAMMYPRIILLAQIFFEWRQIRRSSACKFRTINFLGNDGVIEDRPPDKEELMVKSVKIDSDEFQKLKVITIIFASLDSLHLG